MATLERGSGPVQLDTDNDGKMRKDTGIKMNPATAVLKYEVGNDIKLNEDDFRRLAKAFLSETENRFPG